MGVAALTAIQTETDIRRLIGQAGFFQRLTYRADTPDHCRRAVTLKVLRKVLSAALVVLILNLPERHHAFAAEPSGVQRRNCTAPFGCGRPERLDTPTAGQHATRTGNRDRLFHRGASRYLPSASEVLRPPKPKELLRATSTLRLTA